jgi:hypothetical protein
LEEEWMEKERKGKKEGTGRGARNTMDCGGGRKEGASEMKGGSEKITH